MRKGKFFRSFFCGMAGTVGIVFLFQTAFRLLFASFFHLEEAPLELANQLSGLFFVALALAVGSAITGWSLCEELTNRPFSRLMVWNPGVWLLTFLLMILLLSGAFSVLIVLLLPMGIWLCAALAGFYYGMKLRN